MKTIFLEYGQERFKELWDLVDDRLRKNQLRNDINAILKQKKDNEKKSERKQQQVENRQMLQRKNRYVEATNVITPLNAIRV